MGAGPLRWRLSRQLAVTAIPLCLAGSLAGKSTLSAFSATTANTGNSLASGSVVITDNDADGEMFTLNNLVPGQTDSACIKVTYTGTLDTVVRLYGTTTGTGLDQYLDLRITRGTISSGSFDDCTNFVPDTTDYVGAGTGVIYNGTLQGYADDWANGLVDAAPGLAESWTTNEAHAYKFQLTLQDNNGAQGKNVTQAFTWDARNASCTQVTPAWMTGMEHGVVSTAGGGLFSVLDSAGGSVTADSTVVRSGNYSLRVADSSGGASTYVLTPATPGAVFTTRFAMRLASLPSSSVTQLVGFENGQPKWGYLGYDSATQKLRTGFGGTWTATASSTISAGRWYVIDMRVDTTANPHRIDWRINGVAQPQASEPQNATVVNRMTFGSGLWPDTFTANFDDMLITTVAGSYPVGDGRILPLAPDATGTVTDPSSRLKHDDGTALGASSWQRVDDAAPMTATGDYIKQTAADAGAFVEFSFANTNQTCMRAVGATLAHHSSSTTANSAKTSVFQGTTEHVVYSGAMNAGASLQYRTKGIAISGVINQSVVNALTARVGYATDTGSEPYWDALLLEYEIGL